MQYFYLALTGVAAGVLSGMFGIGGGVVIVPILTLVFGYAQQTASATSLVALLLPVGILGAWQYYQAGKLSNDNIQSGFVIAVGLLVGVYMGVRISIALPEDMLRKAFAVFLVAVAARLWLVK
ncbi:MAG: permease [[Candidatus Thermochlorobacteriaceae] bacterium GBChlB]|nr:MAG: permease [[Candidatus Thermochlorobacteriaceae] bacterium GBChlB]